MLSLLIVRTFHSFNVFWQIVGLFAARVQHPMRSNCLVSSSSTARWIHDSWGTWTVVGGVCWDTFNTVRQRGHDESIEKCWMKQFEQNVCLHFVVHLSVPIICKHIGHSSLVSSIGCTCWERRQNFQNLRKEIIYVRYYTTTRTIVLIL